MQTARQMKSKYINERLLERVAFLLWKGCGECQT